MGCRFVERHSLRAPGGHGYYYDHYDYYYCDGCRCGGVVVMEVIWRLEGSLRQLIKRPLTRAVCTGT